MAEKCDKIEAIVNEMKWMWKESVRKQNVSPANDPCMPSFALQLIL